MDLGEWLWTTVNNQLVTPTKAAVSDVLSLLEQINMAPGMVEWFTKTQLWYHLGDDTLEEWGSIL